jgi:membrane protein
MARQTLGPVAGRGGSIGLPLPRRVALAFGRAVLGFWRHGDLFSSAAISFSALFSLLPLAILLLVGLQVVFPPAAVTHNIGRLFGGLTERDILLRTIREAYTHHESLGLLGALGLVLAATGVFGAVQVALDRVWECRGRIFHLRFLIGILAMAMTLLVFLGMLVGTVLALRLIRQSELGALLGWPRTPPRGAGALGISTTVAQFAIFWIGYRFLPNASVRWRDAWPGALVAAVVWHAIAYGLSWYLARIADLATLYHQLQAIMALLIWVYGLASTFLLGAEFVVQWTAGQAGVPPWPPGGRGA